MSTALNIQTVKSFFAAIGRGDTAAVLALVDENIEWIIPGKDWPLAGTHRGRDGVASAFKRAAAEVPFSYPEPPEYVAQGDRVIVLGYAKGKITATNKSFEDYFVFAVTVRNGKLTNIREYIDTQALAQAAQ